MASKHDESCLLLSKIVFVYSLRIFEVVGFKKKRAEEREKGSQKATEKLMRIMLAFREAQQHGKDKVSRLGSRKAKYKCGWLRPAKTLKPNAFPNGSPPIRKLSPDGLLVQYILVFLLSPRTLHPAVVLKLYFKGPFI